MELHLKQENLNDFFKEYGFDSCTLGIDGNKLHKPKLEKDFSPISHIVVIESYRHRYHTVFIWNKYHLNEMDDYVLVLSLSKEEPKVIIEKNN